jgi:hypothetical protein
MTLSSPISTAPRDGHDHGVRRATAVVALLAIAVWLGGLLALGAIAAPIVFSVAPWPSSADAMALVFRRFDLVAMTCAAIALGTEATQRLARVRFFTVDHVRSGAIALAAAMAVLEGTCISPRIAALHAAGAVRGMGSAGAQLARLHDLAEWCGKGQLVLLVAAVGLHVVSVSAHREP